MFNFYCIGSVDATKVEWARVQSELGNLCSGDKGKCLLFETVVTHTKLVTSIEGGYYGTINDKKSVKYSQFIGNLAKHLLTKNISFLLRQLMSNDRKDHEFHLLKQIVLLLLRNHYTKTTNNCFKILR